MKKIVLLISVAAAALFCSSTVSAQGKYGPDSTECIKYLSYYTEYYKQKNYDSALPNWLTSIAIRLQDILFFQMVLLSYVTSSRRTRTILFTSRSSLTLS